MVILGIAENDAARGVKQSELFEPCSDEQLAKTSTLLVWPDGDRPKAIPVSSGVGNQDRRESYMAYNLALIYRNEGNGQRSVRPQTFNDARFGPAAVGCGLECCCRDMTDCDDVSRSFGPDFQS
jgi:hypothetical protein